METGKQDETQTNAVRLTPPHFSAVFAGLSAVLSAVALFVAIASYSRQPAIDSEKLTLDVIRQSYSDFLSIADLRIAHPLQSHLFELADYYDLSAAAVGTASQRIEKSPAEGARLLLEERAVADRIFTMYEQALYQWQHAERNGDKQRAAFLRDVLDYYTTRLLKNPRLVWYWAADGGKLFEQYEQGTIAHYAKNTAASPLRRAASAPY